MPRLIQPSLDQLADKLHQSCSASVLDGNEVVYIARATQHRLMGVGLHPGSRLPAYCTSMGRVLLAALPADQARALMASSERQKLTSRTLTDLDELMAELDKVRSQGYAIIDQELAAGSRSIAVPIRDLSRQTVAAFNVGVHAAHSTLERLREEFLPPLLDAQAQLAEILP